MKRSRVVSMAPHRKIHGIILALISLVPDVTTSEDCTCQPVFRCGTGVFIQQILRCDGVNHCGDYTDEFDCYPGCNGFKCNNSRCIIASWACDNYNDCSSNEDENCFTIGIASGCNMATDDPFLCNNRVCIPMEQVCDQTDQCGDNSDELNCTECTNATAFSGGSAVAIPAGFTFLPEFQTSYLRTSDGTQSHELAERTCNLKGGRLLLIDSDEKLKKMVAIGEQAYPSSSNPHWIINGRLVNGTWMDWQNRDLLYTSFLESAVNYVPPGNCLKLVVHRYRGIVPADCSVGAQAICEYRVSSFKGALQPRNFQVSASSHRDKYLPQFALNTSLDHGWCAAVSDKHPFLQLQKSNLKDGSILSVKDGELDFESQSLKGVKSFLIIKSNTTNYDKSVPEKQGQIFQLDTSLNVNDIQSVYLCDRRESRYIRIYPLEPWEKDVCLRLMLYGVWKDVNLDFMCGDGSRDVGMVNIGLGLVKERNNSSCNHSSNIITNSDNICISNFSFIERYAENETEHSLWSNANRCKEECSAFLSCNMAKYSWQSDTCYIYTGSPGDLPLIEIEKTNEVIFQRLCLADTSAVDIIGKFVVTEEQRMIFSPGYPLPQNLEVEQTFVWNIDFSKTTTYPVLLFEDLFFDDGVRFELQTASKSHRLFEDGIAYQPSVRSPMSVCNLSVYYRFGSRDSEIIFRFRIIVTNSEFSGSYGVTNNLEPFFHLTGIFSSHIFNGVYASDFRQFKIESAMADYTTLDILDFYVSCSRGIDKAELSIGTNERDYNFCNLRRPWKNFKFSPTEGDLVVRLSFPFQRQEQSPYGITANFSLKGYMDTHQKSNENYGEMRRTQNAYIFGSADVIILLDVTYKSVKVDPRIDYIEKLIWRLKSTSAETNNKTRVGLCAFSDDAEMVFQLKDDWNKTDLAHWFQLHAIKPWKRRCFSCALSSMRSTMFNPSNGDRRGVPNMAIAVLLDSPFPAAASKNELRLAESAGIHVFVINTGQYGLNGITANMEVPNPSQLSDLSVMHAIATIQDAIIIDKVPVMDAVWQVCSKEACYSLYPPVGESRIEFFNTRSDANETCNKNHNGSLAALHSPSELQFVRHYLEQWIVKMKRRDDDSYSVYKELVHIDEMTLSKGNKSIYHWSDGTPVTFTAWSEEVSRLELQRVCVVLTFWKLENDNIWKIGDCEEDSFYFLCKYAADGHKESDFALSSDGNNYMSLSNANERAYKYFVCGSSEYITLFSKCDGIRDCFDGSDEINCTKNEVSKEDCDDMFHCASGECIPYSQYCDYIPDCTDKSDEDCDIASCSETEWQCTNGQCVNTTLRCNGFLDCLDRTDERNCARCERGSYRCVDDTCISNLYVCDGFEDCLDSSDEENCRPEARDSCLEWWKAGYRTTGIYKLTVGTEVFDFECNFERAETEGILITKFHDIDRDHDDGSLFYCSRNVLAHFLGTRDCQQFFTQTCLPNRKAIADNINLEDHEQYWDCLSIEMTVDMGNTKNKTLRACSNVTQRLVSDGVIQLEDMWFYNVDYADITDVTITRNNGTHIYITNSAQEIRLMLGPIKCEEKAPDLPKSIVCRRGKPLDAKLKCLYDFDDFGHLKGCIDFTHLQSCDAFECPIGYFKCPHSYCIAQRFVCDGQNDCRNGEDEAVCNSTETETSYCTGSFKCKGTKICLPEFQLCDGKPHCPEWDDERICGIICPQHCSCTGFEITCNQIDILTFQATQPMKGSVLHLENNEITDLLFLDFPWLAKLNISSSKINTVYRGVFSKMRNLLILDMSHNYIRTLYSYTFEGLSKLNILHLEGNYMLSDVRANAFTGLQQITYLRISKTRINTLVTNTFSGLASLKHLDLSENHIATVEVGAFDGLPNLVLLDMSLNEIREFDKAIFSGLENLNYLVSDDYMFCCLKPDSVRSENCLPHEDEFSSCSDLMRMDGPRYLLWIIGLLALVGNSLALLYRLIYDRSRLRIGYGIFVTNLCASDFLMGVYLIIIAGADLYYRDIYVWNDKAWRFGGLCNFAGVLSTISSEASVFFICLVTIDRLLVIKYPFGQFKFSTKMATIAVCLSWTLALLIAVLPLIYKDYFQDGFYSKNAVCLALPLTRDRPNGWEYSLVVFVFLNFATFLLIAIGQWLIYREIGTSRHSVRSSQRRNDLKVARNLLLVVATDFLCWCPIGVMGLMALSGHVISGDVYVWACVLILPINSALNPFLYTFSAIRNSKAFSPSLDEQTGSVYSNKAFQTFWNSPEFFKPVPGGQPFVSLDDYIQSEKPNQDQIKTITEMLKARIEKLHGLELYHGTLSPENIKIQHCNGKVTEMALELTPKLVWKPEDTAQDCKQLEVISKQLFLRFANDEIKL